FCSSRRRHTRFSRDWSSDVCSSDLFEPEVGVEAELAGDELGLEGEAELVAGGDGDDLGVDVDLGPAEVEAFDESRELGLQALGRSEERRIGTERRLRGAGDGEQSRE